MLIPSVERFTPEDRHKNNDLYAFFKGEGHIDGWSTSDKNRNFRELAKIQDFAGVPLGGSECLDLGCGSGDMAPYLRGLGVEYYLGVDLFEGALQSAHRKYPTEDFVLADLITSPIRHQFDFVFLCGPLTSKVSSNRLKVAYSMISAAWSLTKIGLAFNFNMDSSPYNDVANSGVFYSPIELYALCLKIAPRAKIMLRPNSLIHFANGYVFNYNAVKQPG